MDSVLQLGPLVLPWALIILQGCLCAMNLRGWKKNTAVESG